jgi:hypothetical protein
MKYSSRPTAVQGRIDGAKGMSVIHPYNPAGVCTYTNMIDRTVDTRFA